MGLENFFGSFLNYDYDITHGSPEDCVRAFVECQQEDEVLLARTQLSELLRRTADDDEALRAAVWELGSGWMPADNNELRRLLLGAVDTWTAAAATAS